MEGNAQALPFTDASFDALVNVEASHLYPDVPKFLSEVARVLRPGGHFLYTDFRPRSEVAEWEAALANSSLRQISMSVIDQNVLRGNEKNAPRKHERISRHGAAISRTFARYASDMTDWAVQRRAARRRVHLPRVLVHQGLEAPRYAENCCARQIEGVTWRRRRPTRCGCRPRCGCPSSSRACFS
ncbi:class I SAM-dependent methyltransferase [Mycobacterium sp.]|uniref:class I SAM-dependent methyltransferase n=1 Tax=Mycobacterium sp. TaxID=1785 RepID=UPI0031D4AF51